MNDPLTLTLSLKGRGNEGPLTFALSLTGRGVETGFFVVVARATTISE
jgi:hypothetical protein